MNIVSRVWAACPAFIFIAGALAACGRSPDHPAPAVAAPAAAPVPAASAPQSYAAQHLTDYAAFTLTADLSGFDDNQKRMLLKLIQASEIMDDLFWQQSYGDKQALLAGITDDATRRYTLINYGPWDRLNSNKPFVAGIGQKPLGANFYPTDMSKDEFAKADLPGKASLYTLLRRDSKGALGTVPYHEAYKDQLTQAANLLNEASALSEDQDFKKYLALRAQSLLTDQYQESDFAWLDMKNNPVDVVIGPIETYEDALYGYKASYEAFVFVKDMGWTKRLAHFTQFLPQLQRDLPVPAKYKREKPGSDSDLGAYNAIFYAGDANAGSKTIADNLPNDEQVQLKKGTRRIQIENAIHAKFDKVLMPVARELIVPEQLGNVTFDAFFQNTMFHEVSHGLGIKNTVNRKGTVRLALKDYYSNFEEGKADVLGLFLVEWLADHGELDKHKLMDNYVTFLASIFRSVRFGVSDAHGRANMVRFNYFKDLGAFTRDDTSGRYRVDAAKMRVAVEKLSKTLLQIQGDGDYAAAKRLTDQQGIIGPQLQSDLERLTRDNIPVDIVFQQGLDVLGLKTAAASVTGHP